MDKDKDEEAHGANLQRIGWACRRDPTYSVKLIRHETIFPKVVQGTL